MSPLMAQHYTDATDTRALGFVISAINDVIIQGASIVTYPITELGIVTDMPQSTCANAV